MYHLFLLHQVVFIQLHKQILSDSKQISGLPYRCSENAQQGAATPMPLTT